MKQKHALEIISIILTLDIVVVSLFLLYIYLYRPPTNYTGTTQYTEEIKKEKTISTKDSLQNKISSSISAIYSEEISKAIYFQNQKTGIPIYIILALVDSETEFISSADSFIGASAGRGLTQISEIALCEYNRYHSKKYTNKDLYNIDINLEIGCWMLLQVKEVYPTVLVMENLNLNKTYIEYNVGWSNFISYKKDYYNRYDVPRHKRYNALRRWNSKISYWNSKFKY